MMEARSLKRRFLQEPHGIRHLNFCHTLWLSILEDAALQEKKWSKWNKNIIKNDFSVSIQWHEELLA
jgi:hypothetical protein